MSTNLKINKNAKNTVGVTRFSGFDGSRVQITTARDNRKEFDVSDKFFNSINLNKKEALALIETLTGFVNDSDIETFDSTALRVQKDEWKSDWNKVRPKTAKIDGLTVKTPTFSELLVENQRQVSGSDFNFHDSRRMGTMWGSKFSEDLI
tara:strand:- start:410 stop:859 length:450 start_codon:yes stop_codon:yes gene_type:complete